MPENPIRPTTPEAIDLAKSILANASFAALGVTHPQYGTPHVTRIALGMTPEGHPISLVSDLSTHTKALQASQQCGLLVGEPATKGDPLTHPRLSIQAKATFVTRIDGTFKQIRDHYLSTHPKAKLYIDFADFNFVQFDILSADLNGGFGKAFHLLPDDFSKS